MLFCQNYGEPDKFSLYIYFHKANKEQAKLWDTQSIISKLLQRSL